MASPWIPNHDTDNPPANERKTDDIVRRYGKITYPNLMLHGLLNDPEQSKLLFDALQRQISLVKCRSQTWEDGQITIYDKALLALTSSGDNLTNIGALELYLTEYLGIVPIAPVAHNDHIGSSHLKLQHALTKAASASEPRPREESTVPTNESHPAADDSTNDRLQNRVERLLSVYHQARDEYSDAMRRDGMVNIAVARFLRDSAENALRYMLSNGLGDHAAISELERVFAQARDKAAELLGGRTRHFDPGRPKRRHRRRTRRVIDSYRPGDEANHDSVIRSVLFNLVEGTASPIMASLRPQPTEPALSCSSTGSSSTRYTPVSDSSQEENDRSSSSRPAAGSLRIQTDFSEAHDRDSDDDSQDGYQDGDSPRSHTRASFPKYTAIEERDLVKKFDRKLVPFLALLYMLSFLDRSNIGNAKIAGLMSDLRLSSLQYEWLLTAFYITYILFEWMTLLYRLVPPHIYIAICVSGWGLVASFQSLVTTFGGLVTLRALLGITEAAFGPGVPFYLSLFYKREELAFRNGLFVSAAPLASSFASSLAWVIVKISKDGPIAPWRTLFLVEGFPSVIVAVFAWMLIPDSPGRAWFLSPRQRLVAELRMEEPKPEYHEQQPTRKFNWREVASTLADPKSYITAFMFFSCNVAFSSMPVFLPTIIEECELTPQHSMGYSSLSAQALSAPPYLVAFTVVLLTACLSDRGRSRSPYLIAHALLASLAYLVIALAGEYHSRLPETAHRLLRYLAVYPATSGFFSAITLIMTWTMDNRVAKEGKGTSIAILNVIGQCGPLLGTKLYPRSDGPYYVRGMGVCSLFMLLVAVLALVLRLLLRRANRIAQDVGDEIEMVFRGAAGGDEREGLMGRGHPGTGQEPDAEKFVYIV
ncbi:major facilitator superfamily domain-containing protein [Aspergillus ambiguus]|uniref:putative MFS transporter n=1 Tax=Aspergillus ambiguus TaxID=176160 RepID=UPI003CCE5305